MTETANRNALGLDIGGSSVKWALVHVDSGEPRIVRTGLEQLEPTRDPTDVIAVLGEITRDVRAEYGELSSVGVGLPGLFDAATGSPTLLPNFPDAWHGFPFTASVEAQLGQRITLVNDAKAFSLAESLVGAAAGRDLAVCVVLGTGVGGGVVQHGTLLAGQGSAGELGHLTVELDGPMCGCGNTGCVEAFAGSAAISAYAGQPSAQATFDAARNGDRRAQAAVDRAVRALGIGLSNVFITLAPDVFVIGGGIADAGDELLEPIAAEIRRRVRVAPPEQIRVVNAVLGRHAGAIGAALRSADPIPGSPAACR
jgi:glucokinase